MSAPFVIEPRVGITGLPLDSSRDQVLAFFGQGSKPFRRSPLDNPSDYWPDLGIFAYYRDSGTLEAIEFSSPSEVLLFGKPLLSLSLGAATKALRAADPAAKIESDGAESRSLGVAIWSAVGEKRSPTDTVIVFVDGYYD